jgi:hypothetical protein
VHASQEEERFWCNADARDANELPSENPASLLALQCRRTLLSANNVMVILF